MKWFELSIHTTNEAIEPISNILHEAGASGVVIEDPLELTRERPQKFGEIYELDPLDYPQEGVIMKAYLAQTAEFAETVSHIKKTITALQTFQIDIGKNKVSLEEVHEEDWATAWKQYYHPVRVSDRITIVPTWEDYEPTDEDELIVELDPGLAFGTGTHETTQLCIRALEKYVRPGDAVFDVGTGSGVLSIVAARLGAGQMKAYDLDEVAVSAARGNIALNKMEEQITVAQNNLLAGVAEKADVVVANILAEIVILLTSQAAKVVKPNGYFISSGIIKKKQDEVQETLEAHNFTVIEKLTTEEWVAFVAQKNNE